jgi:hypothetical protein
MAFHNNGRKYFHLLDCNGNSHWYITDGMLFGLDEILCKRHKQYTAILKSNMNKNDAELHDLQMQGNK